MQTSIYTRTATGKTQDNRFGSWILTLTIAVIALLSSVTTEAQLTGTKNIPGDYATLAVAITDLNSVGVGTGGVTFNLVAANPQTAPVGGYVIGGASGAALITGANSSTAANPVIITGNGNTITAGLQVANTFNDAIFKLVGADFITIQGFTLQENGGNTVVTPLASNTMTEWGVALLYATTTNGSQNNTIQNNTISLNRLYSNSFGIYSNVLHIDGPTSANITTVADIANATTAPNSGNKVYSNNISNINLGIVFVGSRISANQDNGNDVGGSSAVQGNIITNFSGGTAMGTTFPSVSATILGIYFNHQRSANISNNSITSAVVTANTTMRGIAMDFVVAAPLGTFTNNITNNTITLRELGASATAFSMQGMLLANNSLVPNANVTANITGNSIINCAVTGATSNITIIGILQAATFGTVNINSNIIAGNTNSSNAPNAGAFTGIQNQGAVINNMNMNFNQIGTVAQNAMTYSGTTGTTGAIGGIFNLTTAASGMNLSISNNDFRGFVQNVAGTGSHTYITNNAASATNAPLTVSISDNKFTNITANTTGSVTFISASTSLVAGGSKTISNNSIVGTFSKTGTGGTVTFHVNGGSSVTGSTNVSTGNNFSNVTVIGTTVIAGWNNQDGLSASSGPTKTFTGNIFNNITNLPAGTGSISIAQFNFGGSTADNISTNTITNINGGGNVTGIAIGNGSGSNVVTAATNTINNLSTAGASAVVTGISVVSGTSTAVTGNFINTLSASGATSPVVHGINISGGTLVNVSKNKIYDLFASAAIATTAGAVNGITLSGGTTVNAYNNLIGDLRAPAANLADAIRGIAVTSITASSNYNVYFNTVHLNASSTGANFGTTGIFHTANAVSTVAALDLRNNIVVNLSTPAGTGITSALARSAAVTLTNYASTSNRNLLYAGTPGASRVILNDGGTGYQTFGPAITGGTFQNYVAGREANSFSNEGSFNYGIAGSYFQSLTGSNANFLHLVAGISTLAESGGSPITSPAITDDYDGNTRNVSTPDVGADEFIGITPGPSVTLNSVTPGATPACVASSRLVSVNVTTPSGTITSVTLNYSYNGISQPAVTMVNTSGIIWTGTIPAATSPANATVAWSVTAVNSISISGALTGTTYADVPLTGVTATATASTNPVCSGSPTTLTAALTVAIPAAPAASTYCASTHASGCTAGSGDDNIARVVLNTLDNTTGVTGCSATGFYSNFSGLGGTTTTTLTGSTGYNITLTFGPDATQFFGAWIDYNHNGVYSASEFLGASGNAGASGIISVFFTVPLSAYNGLTHMRVVGGNDVTVLSTQACGASSSAFGETQDYDVTITGAATAAPYGGSITAYSWSDGVGTVGSTNPLVVSPTSNTTYTATVTAANCPIITNGVSITTIALPAGPATGPSTQCGTGVPLCFATGTSNGNYRWYLAPTGGTALPGQVNDVLSGYSISATTTFYISIFNGTCESLRTSVIATVNIPDAVQALVSNNNPCLNSPITLTAQQTGSTNTYIFTWTASPASGSGIPVSQIGSPITITPTAAGTYIYTVTAVDGTLGCTTTSTVSVTVKSLPVITAVTATPATICAGQSSSLNANTTITINSGSAPSYCSASNPGNGCINNLVFNTLSNSALTCTSGYTLFPASGTTTTTVTTGQTYSLTVGTDASDIVSVWIDFDRNGVYDATEWFQPYTTGTSGTISIAIPANASTGQTGMRVRSRFTGNTNGSGNACTAMGSGETEDYVITIQTLVNDLTLTYVWNPGSIAGQTVSVSPISTQAYTVTVFKPSTGCSNTATTTVTVIQLPAAPSATPSAQCGTSIPTASVSSNSGAPTPNFQWYLVPTGGTAVQTGTSVTYLSAVSVTTTFYVSELSTTGCESNRTPLTVTVSTPDPLTVSATVTNVCLGGSTTISSSYTPDFNVFATFTLTVNNQTGSGITNPVTLTPNAGGSNPYVITPTAPGTYIYTITAYDPDKGCTSVNTVTVTVNPIPTGLTAGSNIANVCTGSTVNLTAFANSNTSTNTVYNEGFETAFPPTGWAPVVNLGPSPRQWEPLVNGGLVGNPNTAHTGTVCMMYIRNGGTQAANTWAFTPGQSFAAGSTYTLKFWYETFSGGGVFPESLKITIGNSPTVAAQTTTLWDNNGAANLLNTTYVQAVITFTPVTTGTYYFAFNCYSGANDNVLLIDDVEISGPTPIPATYSWTSSPAGFTSTQQNPTGVVVNANTIYSVVATNSTGCPAAAPATVSITALPLPAAPSASPVTRCGPGSVTLTATGTGGTLNWYNVPTGGTSLQTGGTYTTTVPGSTSFYVAETSAAGCAGPRTQVNVTVTPAPALSITPSGATTFCQGGSVGLTAAGAGYVNFAWSPATGLNATNVAAVTASPTTTQTYTVAANDGVSGPLGCANTANVTVTVNPNPVVDSIRANPTSICIGGSSVLNVYSSSPVTGPQSLPGIYCIPAQSGGVSNITSVTFNTLSNINVTQVSPFYDIYPATGSTTTTVSAGQTYTMNLATINGSSIISVWIDYNRDGLYDPAEWTQPWTAATSGSVSITIPANAVAGLTGMRIRTRAGGNVNGSGDACSTFGSGSAQDYSINIVGLNTQNPALTYLWSPGGTTPALPSTTVSPVVTTTYNVTVTNTAFTPACSSTSSITLLVLPVAASASASPNVSCAGSAVVLNANATGGAPLTYLWSTGGTTASITVNPTVTTTYTVTVTDPCSNSTTSSVTVTVNPLPTSGITPAGPLAICSPATQLLTATTNAASPGYQWTLNGVNIPAATSSTYTVSGIGTGSYRVIVTSGVTNCSNTSAAVMVTINPQPAAVSITPASAIICTGASQSLTASSAFGPAAATATSGAISIAIPDVNSAGISNSLVVSGVPFASTIDSVIVQFSITHAFASDMIVNLEAPNGQILNLVSGVSLAGSDFTNTRISSNNAKPLITSGTAPYTATFRAAGLLTGFQLAPLPSPTTASYSALFGSGNGTWTLRVYDDEAADLGTLTNWNIKVSYNIPASTFAWTPATGLNTTTGATVIASPLTTTTYTATATNSFGCTNTGTAVVTVGDCPVTANLKLWLQGYYQPGGGGLMLPVLSTQGIVAPATETDSVTIELHDPITYALVDTKIAVINTDGTVSATFGPHPFAPYYIAVKHRNSSQTWSANPVNVTGTSTPYNFTTASTQALNDPAPGALTSMAEVETGIWAIRTGDINQDDFIDGSDFTPFDTESASGGLFDGTYTASDMNGDGFVDGSDLPVFDGNSSIGVTSYHY